MKISEFLAEFKDLIAALAAAERDDPGGNKYLTWGDAARAHGYAPEDLFDRIAEAVYLGDVTPAVMDAWIAAARRAESP